MNTLQNLKKKIETVADLLSVVRTMKSLAAVNIRQFERAAHSLEEYSRIVDLGWTALFRSRGRISSKRKPPLEAVHLVIGSDQGMCGPFNETILALTLEKERELSEKGVQTFFWSVGERMRSGLEEEGKKVHEHFALPGSIQGINEGVQALTLAFESWQNERGSDILYLSYNQLFKGSAYQPLHSRILPLDPSWQEAYTKERWPGRCLPLLGLEEEALFRHLFRQYVFVSFYRAFAQSMASENAARLRAMQAAEKNILELEESLLARFREMRQNTITSELLDIITGFEAISEEAG
jgi:F-type H+-transporting ATPase subunit gamma